jgi:alkylhydroperoxidase family enzyme
VEHHFTGMCRLIGDAARGAAIRAALEAGAPERAFDGAELALMRYALRLTRTPAAVTAGDFALLRAAGLDDGRILEANQVIAYFGYANRTVLGLGVTTEGDILGLAPGNLDDRDDWSHR